MKWSYGVTSCKNRMDNLLIQTLNSLAAGGFDDPVVFIDGVDCGKTGVIHRPVKLGPFGNWILGIWELYIRQPLADRYAMFQDDMVCYQNLRQYLETCEYPKCGYWNLYTWPVNVKENMPGFSLSDQMGRGAVALVFDNATLRHLLKQEYLIEHRQNAHTGHKGIDKAVMESMKRSGYVEYIHNPSLVQHVGEFSSSGNKLNCLESPVFLGENFDAMK